MTDPDHHVITASRIGRERERLGHSQTKMAELLDIGRTTYIQLERRANPTLSTLQKLVDLGMRIEAIAPELFDRKPTKSRKKTPSGQ